MLALIKKVLESEEKPIGLDSEKMLSMRTVENVLAVERL